MAHGARASSACDSIEPGDQTLVHDAGRLLLHPVTDLLHQMQLEVRVEHGQTLIVWDTLFGTRFLPADREPPEEIGIPHLPAFPMTWWAQIRSPFQWEKIQRESAEQSKRSVQAT
jgi:hypothetical protein